MADGLITDCRMLLSRFEKLKTVRFEKFCEVWREMNFSLIHWYARIFLMIILVLFMCEILQAVVPGAVPGVVKLMRLFWLCFSGGRDSNRRIQV